MFHPSLRLTASGFVLVAGALPCHAATPQLEATRSFVKAHLMGHTVTRRSTSLIAGGTVQAEFERRLAFTGYAETARGLMFDYVAVISQTNRDMIDGLPTGAAHSVNRTVQIHCEAKAFDYAPTVLRGSCRYPINTLSEPTGRSDTTILEIRDNVLVQTLEASFPDDCFASGGATYPCRSDTVYRFDHSESGTLRMSESSTTFRADPISGAKLEQTSVGEFVSIEDL